MNEYEEKIVKEMKDALFMLRIDQEATIEFKDRIQDIEMKIDKYLGMKELGD